MDNKILDVPNESRRHFIVKSARTTGLMVGVALCGGSALGKSRPHPPHKPPPAPPPPVPTPPPTTIAASTVNAWINVGTDESITILVGSAEMGQAVVDALA